MYVYVKGGYRSGVKGAIRILPRAERAKIFRAHPNFWRPAPNWHVGGAPDKGVELKLVRGENYFGLRACERFFNLLGMIFAPLEAYFFNFFSLYR